MGQPLMPAHVPLAGGGQQVIATFVARPNRFVVDAQLSDGTLVRAHMADRCAEESGQSACQ